MSEWVVSVGGREGEINYEVIIAYSNIQYSHKV